MAVPCRRGGPVHPSDRRLVDGGGDGEPIGGRCPADGFGAEVAGKGLLAHSDRGSPYASEHYHSLLARHGIACSMSEVAQCWDNAPVESFFASLKKELTHDERYASREQARGSIFEYIETF